MGIIFPPFPLFLVILSALLKHCFQFFMFGNVRCWVASPRTALFVVVKDFISKIFGVIVAGSDIFPGNWFALFYQFVLVNLERLANEMEAYFTASLLTVAQIPRNPVFMWNPRAMQSVANQINATIQGVK
ncbi:hypothetical protein BU23DRAFT_573139 [Bimuria novae-zelandiae CBS 107.79]|uniref:Uncharacterized protein n=1 Tax=Bimuria novae-zelandiae CBS 107.79 TaxID=1447943 RepID=A0A6A5URL9_9PLEO|nr:hypothetical protein BU23DRAFT_573139 [Bimuria novae-zelandiae CBS 107.79]